MGRSLNESTRWPCPTFHVRDAPKVGEQYSNRYSNAVCTTANQDALLGLLRSRPTGRGNAAGRRMWSDVGVIAQVLDADRRRAVSRVLAALSGVCGVLLLVRPRPIVEALCPEFPESKRWVVRVLGARLVVQHAVVLASPARRHVRAATAMDLLHAASMVPLLWSPRYRRAALVSGGYAAMYAATARAVAPRS